MCRRRPRVGSLTNSTVPQHRVLSVPHGFSRHNTKSEKVQLGTTRARIRRVLVEKGWNQTH